MRPKRKKTKTRLFFIMAVIVIVAALVLFVNLRNDKAVNIFENGGFESGSKPWISLRTRAWGKPFSVSDEMAHSGSHSALLELDVSQNTSKGTGFIYGVVQEVTPLEFPDVVGGYYYVKDWVKAADKQYLQFVVIASGCDNLPGRFNNHQIRYILSNIDKKPFRISNAKFVFIDANEPRMGEWVKFERPLARDFEELWGAVPIGFDKLRILFEVRCDGRVFGQSKANVYYDDLYLEVRQPDGP